MAFHKPVSKRDAPDYYLGLSRTDVGVLICTVVQKPMDLTTVLKNIKTHKYKSKADFGSDLDLIWENCLLYNSSEVSSIHAQS